MINKILSVVVGLSLIYFCLKPFAYNKENIPEIDATGIKFYNNSNHYREEL